MAPTGPTPVSRRALTLAERISVIKQYEKNADTRSLAKEFNCGRTQITTTIRHKEEYLKAWESNADPTRRRRKRSGELMFLGMIVNEWIRRCRQFGVVVTDNLIRKIAARCAELINYHDFRATKRWLERLKSKYKLSVAFLRGPSPDQTNRENLTEQSLQLENIIKDLQSQNDCVNYKEIDRSESAEDEQNRPQKLKQYGNKRLKNGQRLEKETCSDNSVEVEVMEIKPNISDLYLQFSEDSQSSESNQPNWTGEMMVDPCAGVEAECAKEIHSYKEALNHLGPLEQFLLMEEDIRAVGLINQLENIFREKMSMK